MSKTVRFENADTNKDKMVVVEIWRKDPQGQAYDTFVRAEFLRHPTAMSSFTLTNDTYLKVLEKDTEQN